MIWKNKKTIHFLLIITIIFSTLVINLLLHFNNMKSSYIDKTIKNDKYEYNYPYFRDNKDLYIKKYLNVIDKDKVDNIKYIVNYLSDEYTSVLFKLYKNDTIVNYKSMIFNKYKLTNIDSVITNKEEFYNKLLDYVEINNLKISKDNIVNGNKSYLFKDKELDIFLTDYDNKNTITLLTINYKEITNYLNFPHNIDPNYDKIENNNEEITNPIIAPIDKSKKLVAFTFDDGPTKYSLQIADVLDAFKANSTFFLVGYNIKIHNDIVLDLYNRGFELGNHTIDHSRLTKFDCEKIEEKIEKNNKLAKNITNENIKLFRPPYGAICEEIKPCMKYPIIFWSVDSKDWETRNVESIVYEVMSNVKDGDIILFHDLYETTVESIKVILPLLYADNFQVVSVSELFKAKDIELKNGETYRKSIVDEIPKEIIENN